MYEHIWRGHELVQRFYEKTSMEEVRQAVIELQSDPRFDELTDVISDFLGCEIAPVHIEVMEEIAALDGAASLSNIRIRDAVVTDSPQIMRAVEAYIASGLSPYPMQIFSSTELARKWLVSKPTRSDFGRRIYKVVTQKFGAFSREFAALFLRRYGWKHSSGTAHCE